MSEPWAPALVTLDVLTLKRASEERVMVAAGCHFLLRLHTDGEDGPIDMSAANFADVAEFIAEMSPREVRIIVGKGEDAELIRQRLGARLQ